MTEGYSKDGVSPFRVCQSNGFCCAIICTLKALFANGRTTAAPMFGE